VKGPDKPILMVSAAMLEKDKPSATLATSSFNLKFMGLLRLLCQLFFAKKRWI
jgi:hypothetical protein